MTYDRTDAREQARNALASRLAAVRAQLGSRDALREEETHLLWELEGLEREEARERAARAPTRLPDGSTISIASPCAERWDAMVGDERVRHCSRCDKDVYNLSGMSADEISALLARRGERPCVRFFKRKDGTMLTADCPVGRPKKLALRVVALAGMALGAGGVALVAAARLHRTTCANRPFAHTNEPTVEMGEPTVEPGEPTLPPIDYTEVAGGLEASP